MTVAVHLIERMGHVRAVDAAAGQYESEWRAIAPETAERLVGGRIYLHQAQDKPSFIGGTITAYRLETQGQWAGRVIFSFVRDAAGKGDASRGGWGNEKKFAWLTAGPAIALSLLSLGLLVFLPSPPGTPVRRGRLTQEVGP